jgi:hypothetical protein
LPVAVKVAEDPEQMVVVGELTETVGFGVTETATVLVPAQPEVVPITVYVVEEVGVTDTVDVVAPLGIQEYVVAPEAVKVTAEPLHTELLDAATDTEGRALTF